MYLPLSFSTTRISALSDCGSTINLMSHELFDRLPLNNKVHVDHCHESIVLDNYLLCMKYSQFDIFTEVYHDCILYLS